MEKQSKTESNNTKWKIQIDGDKRYIDDLFSVFKTLNFEASIYREGENIYLESKMFDNITDAKEIAPKAKTFLTLISTLPHFKSERAIEPLKVLKIFYKDRNVEKVYDPEGNPESSVEISKDGKRSIRMYVGLGTFKITGNAVYLATSKDGQILGGLTTIESIKNYLKTNNESESLKNLAGYLKPFLENLVKYSNNFSNEKITEEILTVLSNIETKTTTFKWVNLYKIYELIEKAVGNEKKLKDKNWVNKEQINSFNSTNNYYHRHSVFRVFYKKPKDREMDLQEAEEMISQLLLKYIEEKVQNQGGLP
jgi:hypothetical protein